MPFPAALPLLSSEVPVVMLTALTEARVSRDSEGSELTVVAAGEADAVSVISVPDSSKESSVTAVAVSQAQRDKPDTAIRAAKELTSEDFTLRYILHSYPLIPNKCNYIPSSKIIQYELSDVLSGGFVKEDLPGREAQDHTAVPEE